MRHAILGAGGVGGLVGAALARGGSDVELVLTPGTLAAYPGRIDVESGLLGDFAVEVAASGRLRPPVDVLWITVKATQLEAALEMAPPAAAGDALVVPLLNGVDHVDRLREAYGDAVVAAAIRVEAERTANLRIVHRSPFASIDLAPRPRLVSRAEALAGEVRATGLACSSGWDEGRVLWGKLAMLAPFALATTSLGLPAGGVRADPETLALMLACSREVCAVAAAEGTELDPEIYQQALAAVPGSMSTSMQRDRAAGRPLELDAIAGVVVRRGAAAGVPTPATAELRNRVAGAVSRS